MNCKHYPLARAPHATRLVADYLENFPRLSRYFAHPPTRAGVLEAAGAARVSPGLRGPVADALREQNRQFGADEAVLANIEKFRNGALAIVSGQQVGLFSGPAFSFYKALAAVRLARELSASGVEAVPLFWLATEDHDLAEVNQCYWATRTGLERFTLPFPDDVAGTPVGRIPLPAEVAALVETASSKLEGPSTPSVSGALAEAYKPGETLANAFARTLARLLSGRGLILVDPLDVRLRQLAKPLYLAAVEQRDAVDAGLLARAEELAREGYHAQVRVSENGTLLFWEGDGRRHAVECRGGKFHAGERSWAREEFREAIAAEPQFASGNVLLRPVVQDALLGTAAAICGGAEIAYLAQAEVAYSRLGVPMPAVLPRPGFTLIEPALERLLVKYHLEIGDVFAGREHLRARMERESLPGSLTERFEAGEGKLKEVFANLAEPLAQLDSTLAGALETVERKMLYQYEKLHEKAGRALGLRTGILDRHEQLLIDLLYPHHGLQERSLSFLPLLAGQGMQLLDALEQHASPEAGLHLVVSLDHSAGAKSE